MTADTFVTSTCPTQRSSRFTCWLTSQVIFTLHRLHQIISQPSPLISGRVKHVFPFLGIKEVLSSKGQNLLVTSSHSSDVRTGDSLQVWGLMFTCSQRCPLVEVNSFSRCVHTVVVIVSVFFVVEGLCDFYWPQSNCFMTSGKRWVAL